jgi:ribulose-5-phosphate 4-epimerase/fuculose-1-phosphate aldolase
MQAFARLKAAGAAVRKKDQEEIPVLDHVRNPLSVAESSLYYPEQKDRVFPQVPKFNNVAEERQHKKKRLVAACRAFAREHFDYGFAGHLTVRDPEHPDLYWTNPMAVHFAQVRLSNLILVDHDGKVVDGKHAVNRAGFVLHAAVHEAHPEIVSMCHAHTIYGTAFAALGKPLLSISQDAAAFHDDCVVISEEGGQVVLEQKAGHTVATAFKSAKAGIHQNHGLFTVSRSSIDAAAFWFISLERLCRQQLLIEATGQKPTLVPQKHVQYSREHLGTEYIAWLNFQPVYDYLEATEPDMFD